MSTSADRTLSVGRPNPHWPVDILHCSDLHFLGSDRSNKPRSDHWKAFLDHVTDYVDRGIVHPHSIAFTGDLVESAGPWSAAAFRRGVNALLELAERCGFLAEGDRWPRDQKIPPDAWWNLLNKRIYIVPGNHDLYPMGLRFLWLRWSKAWSNIVSPVVRTGQTQHRAEPVVAALADPLAVMMINSNGKRAFWGSARGGVDNQINLRWPASLDIQDRHFRVALVHGHPIQVPYFLEGVFDAEASLGIENAGLLMKNLASLGVRLVLHGHRHYPAVYTLRIQDVDGTPKSIVIVGAGSVTKAPSRWPRFCYDWVRIYADHSVEVAMPKRAPGEPVFEGMPNWFLADPGNFSCEEVNKRVRVGPEGGDLDVRISIRGFRVSPGRPPVSRIPFGTPPGQILASRFSVSPPKLDRNLSWGPTSTSLILEPPLKYGEEPLALEIHYYTHGGVASTEWQAEQLYGVKRPTWQENVSFQPHCDLGRIQMEVSLPDNFDDGDHKKSESFTGRSRLSDTSEERIKHNWDPVQRRLSIDYVRPSPKNCYELLWPLKRHTPAGRNLSGRTLRKYATEELAMRLWQRRMLRGIEKERVFDDLCQEVVQRCNDKHGLYNPDIALILPYTNDLRRLPDQEEETPQLCRLYMAGFESRSSPPPSDPLPFGFGVAGRAHWMGRAVMYHFDEARSTVSNFELHGIGNPRNFHMHDSNSHYLAFLAAPIYPYWIRRELGVDVRQPDMALAILTVGTTTPGSPLLTWDDAEIDEFLLDLQHILELRFRKRIRRYTSPTTGPRVEIPSSNSRVS